MTKVKCEVCGKEIDARGISGHMRTHQSKTDVVSKVQSSDTDREKQVKEQVDKGVLTYPEQKPVKKSVKKVTKKTPKFINDKHADKKENKSVQETVPKKESWEGFFV